MLILAWMAALLAWGWLTWFAFVRLENAEMLGWGMIIGLVGIACIALYSIFSR